MEETGMNIKIRKFTAALAATVLLFSFTAPAQASDGGVVFGDSTVQFTCADLDIEGLRTLFDGYTTLANEDKNRESLRRKLVEAQEKFDKGRMCDAALKVEDFGTKIDRLWTRGGKPKIFDEYDGAAIQCLLVGAEHLAATFRKDNNCGEVTAPPRGKGPKNN
jgi:hypothetical protein